MESNKYYLPEIEEFHQGFEYEVWYSSAYTEEKWIKETFEFYDKDEIYHYDCVDLIPSFKNHSDSIRVKYLDKEDIESLGWKFDEDEISCLAFVKNIWDLWYYERKQLLTIESEETGVVFKGYIKNKSELKKLLKQLQINE